jgi:hypothetical protein
MGDAHKSQLHDAIARLSREKQLLESQVKSLLAQKIQLEKSLTIDTDAKKVCARILSVQSILLSILFIILTYLR